MPDPFRTDVIRDLAGLPTTRRSDDQVDAALIACADEIDRLTAEREQIFREALDAAAQVARETIVDARMGDIESDLRVVGHWLDERINAIERGEHRKAPGET